jgi:hypothetical protein
MGTDIFQRVLEVGPNEKGQGSKMVLLWDGAEKAIAEAEFDGQAITADISPKRLLLDVRELTEQACNGELQIVSRDENLIRELEKQYG